MKNRLLASFLIQMHCIAKMYLIIDVETSGLPRSRSASFKDLEAFDSARVVSIAWQFLNESFDLVKSVSLIVKPDGFKIPFSAQRIHGISQDVAVKNGSEWRDVCRELLIDLKRCKVIVAHNMGFDFNVIRSELYRSKQNACLYELNKKERVCTMLTGKSHFRLRKFPKLVELYNKVMGRDPDTPLDHAHNAMYDVDHCRQCFVYLTHRAAKRSL